MSMTALFDAPQALPTIPKVTQELISSFGREDVAIDEIAHQLSADPVLSAKTLRLANSAYCSGPMKSQAAAYLTRGS